MSDDSEWEDASKHNALLDDIRNLDRDPKAAPKATASKKIRQKVDMGDLLGSIKSTRNLGDLKKRLEGYEEDEITEKDAVASVQHKLRQKFGKSHVTLAQRESAASKKVLSAPLHRQAKRRIESKVVYEDVKKEMGQWGAIVHANRVAETIHFPLTEDPKAFSRRPLAAEKAQDFKPRTDIERLTAEVLGTSKYNLTNADNYCEAEKEVIKSMSVKEARKRCEELQRMRALTSYKGAKLKQQAKIKSKQYHRIHKREKCRKLIKEIEALLVKDPEAATERLKDLEKDRTYERATLKHRGLNRWSREMKQFAARNSQARKILGDHLRLGRELKAHSAVGDALDDDEEGGVDDKKLADVKKRLTVSEIVESAVEQAEREDKAKEASSLQIINQNNPFLKSALEAIREERRQLVEQAKVRDATTTAKTTCKSSAGDGNLLVLNARPAISLPDELMNGVNEYDAEMQGNFLAEAYQDDDVLDDFREEKRRVEEAERPKNDADELKNSGWGSWTGPGVKERKKPVVIRQLVKRQQRRQDADHDRLIIRESVSQGVADLQPRDVPFPFTSVRDYETYIGQPLGRDWSSELAQRMLVRPKIHTSAGRIIRPMEKSMKQRVLESDDSD